MLSYRHAFHAGNHADVLKHLCLVLALEHLSKKDKPLCYIDTHAGPGSCSLDEGPATLNAEYQSGITRLFDSPGLPAPLARYVEVIRQFNPRGALSLYPGSPAIARQLLHVDNRMELCELHPDDFQKLQIWAGRTRQVRICQEDGFKRLKALLPPIERRALVLIDPPYEVKQDYSVVINSLEGALRRFSTGVYLLWYPLLQRPEVPGMLSELKQLPVRHLQVELKVCASTSGGMFGSGLFVFNPPFQMAEQLRACETALIQTLGQDVDAGFLLDSRGLE